MAIGDNVVGSMARARELNSSPGSVQSDWQVLYDDATTASGALDHLVPSLQDDSVAHRITIPDGATRILIRARYDAGADVFTTSPIIRLTGTDSDGVPLRIDNVDSNAAGVTVTCEAASAVPSTGLTAGTDYTFSNVTTLDGYDLKGCRYLYVTVATAANILDGAVQLPVAIMGLFLN